MNWIFLILAVFTLTAALGAVLLRNMIHCALSAALAFVGIALLFLQLGAQFVGLAQALIYVGAIAILIVFAILLTRCGVARADTPVWSKTWLAGLLTAVAALAVMVMAIFASPSLLRPPPAEPALTVKAIGASLMSRYVLPLEILGLLLTAALIGAAVLAMPEKGDRK